MTQALKNDPELLEAALRGFAGDVDDADQFSSPVWFAHVAGANVSHNSKSVPVKCAMSGSKSVKLETECGEQWLVDFVSKYFIPRPRRVA